MQDVEATTLARIKVRWHPLLTVVVTAHAVLVLVLAARLNLWIDETYSLLTTQGGLRHALRQALEFELQAPLYFLLLAAWRGLSESALFARLFSVTCSVGCVVLAAQLARRYLPATNPALVALVTAFHPLVVYSAVEIRGYSLILLLSALLLILFHDAFLRDSRLAASGYVVVSCAALYTQYYLGFLLAANGVALIVLRRWKGAGRYALAMLLVAAMFAPMAWVLPRQFDLHTGSISASESMIESVKRILWRDLEYAVPTWWMGELDLWNARNVVGLTLLILGALAFWKRRPGPPATIHLTVWIVTAVLSLVFLAALRRVGDQLLLVNHTAALFFPVVLSVLAVLDGPGRGPTRGLFTAAVLVFDLAALGVTYAPMAKPGDYERAARYIMEHENRDEPILVFTPEAALVLDRYYTGPNALVPIPGPEDLKVYDVSELALDSEEDIWSALEGAPGWSSRAWLYNEIRRPCTYLGVSLNCHVLERFVEDHFEVRARRELFRGEVRLLERRAVAPADSPAEERYTGK